MAMSEPLQRLAPWPQNAGVLSDFGEAVDQLLRVEETETGSSNGRRFRNTLGREALKLQQQVARHFVYLEMNQQKSGFRALELDCLVPVALEFSGMDLQEVSDPMVWDDDGSLLQEVGPLRAGWFLFGGEALGGRLIKLQGSKHQAALHRLEEMSGWYIPTKAVEFRCFLAIGIPILDAVCHQMHLLEAWATRHEARIASEQWCSRSFAMAMLAASTSKEKQRKFDGQSQTPGLKPLLPAHYEDPPFHRSDHSHHSNPLQGKSSRQRPAPPVRHGGSKAQNVAFWLSKPKAPPPPPVPPAPLPPAPPGPPPPPPPPP